MKHELVDRSAAKEILFETRSGSRQCKACGAERSAAKDHDLYFSPSAAIQVKRPLPQGDG